MGAWSTIKAGINVVGDALNVLTDSSIKNFYSLRDFYNFIRKEQNCPMQHANFFTIVPEFYSAGLAAQNDGSTKNENNLLKSITDQFSQDDTGYFKFDEYNLARFALAATSIDSIKDISLGGQQPVDNMMGRYSYQNFDNKFNSTSNSLNITFIEMADPIIQSFIIPWMIYMQKNAKSGEDQYAKLNLIIKFYRADSIAGLDFLMNPTFIYRVTGLYPTSANLVTPKHSGSNQLTNRSVTFTYNNLMVFSNAKYQALITGNRQYFAYDDLSPLALLNKLNQQASNVSTIYNKVKNIF